MKKHTFIISNNFLPGHVPIHPKASDEFALLWNYKEVLETLWSFESLVIGYIAGHSHEGAYFLDEKNIHHLTLHAVVESDPDTNAFATGHVYDDFLLIEGYGRIKNYRFDYWILSIFQCEKK